MVVREWLGYEDAAAYLKLTPRQLRRWVAEDKIVYTKLGGRVRFNPDDLDRWLEHQTKNRPEIGA